MWLMTADFWLLTGWLTTADDPLNVEYSSQTIYFSEYGFIIQSTDNKNQVITSGLQLKTSTIMNKN